MITEIRVQGVDIKLNGFVRHAHYGWVAEVINIVKRSDGHWVSVIRPGNVVEGYDAGRFSDSGDANLAPFDTSYL